MVNFAKFCIFAVLAGQELFIEMRFFQGRSIHHDVAIAVPFVCHNALESVGIFFLFCVSYIKVRVIGCDKDIVRTPSVQIQCTCNMLKFWFPIIWLEMACINGIYNGLSGIVIYITLIVVADCLIELAEGYPVALINRIIIIVVLTVLAVQFVICIIVIQRTGNILCVWFFRKRNGFNIYYFSASSASFLPRFGITQGTFWSPVAATSGTFIYCIVIRIRIEAIFVICGNRQPLCTYSISFCRIVIVNFFTGKDD